MPYRPLEFSAFIVKVIPLLLLVILGASHASPVQFVINIPVVDLLLQLNPLNIVAVAEPPEAKVWESKARKVPDLETSLRITLPLGLRISSP